MDNYSRDDETIQSHMARMASIEAEVARTKERAKKDMEWNSKDPEYRGYGKYKEYDPYSDGYETTHWETTQDGFVEEKDNSTSAERELRAKVKELTRERDRLQSDIGDLHTKNKNLRKEIGKFTTWKKRLKENSSGSRMKKMARRINPSIKRKCTCSNYE